MSEENQDFAIVVSGSTDPDLLLEIEQSLPERWSSLDIY